MPVLIDDKLYILLNSQQWKNLSKDLGEENNKNKRTECAERLSRSMEKWLWDGIKIDLNKEEIIRKFYKLNPFSPDKYIDKSLESQFENPQKFYEKFKQFKEELENLADIEEEFNYHFLYFLAPLKWFEEFPNLPPVLDPFIPTYTVFDHIASASALLNILDINGDKLNFKGSVAILEFPSIQEFILLSRKTRDLWASSWISSVLLWKSIETFVENYGPDIVIRPELSLNHFFISWLYNKVKNPNKRELIKRYASLYAGLDNYPRIAMMSERVILLLPEEDSQSISRRLIENFNMAWKSVANEVLKEFHLEKDLTPSIDDYIKGAVNNPPIKPVIKIFSVNEIFKEFSERLGLNEVSCSEDLPIELSLFFEFILENSLNYRKAKYSYGYLIKENIEAITKDSNYELCTVCGLLPSIFYYYIESGDEKITIDNKDGGSFEDRLCPYCAIKRGLRGEVVDEVVRKINLAILNDESKFIIPSTSALSLANFAYHFWLKIAEKDKTEADKIKKYENNLESFLLNSPLGNQSEEYIKVYYENNERARELLSKYQNDKEIKALMMKYGNTYYAIIKADGDNMGRGFWKGNLYIGKNDNSTISKYIESFADSIMKINKGNGVLGEGTIEKLKSNSKSVQDKLIKIREKLSDRNTNGIKTSTKDGNEENFNRIPVTIAYAYSLSRSLTAQAIIDNYLVRKNHAVPIYLGGDDMLLLSPLKFADNEVPLKVSLETRESYWSYSDDSEKRDGFKIFKGIVQDSLRPYGRSYSIYISHYHDPLPLSMSIASSLLEKKDEVEGKDTLFISSGRGIYGVDYSIIKYSESDVLHQKILELILEIKKLIEEKKLSRSLIYDIDSILEYRQEGKIYENLVYKIIKRNSTDEKCASNLIEKLEGIIGKEVCNDIESSESKICEDKESFINIIKAVYYLGE